jgi:hypothetical protein
MNGAKKSGIALLEGGSVILGGLAIAAEVLDPTTYISSGKGAIPPQAVETWFGYTYPRSSSSANGGFVIYPNKPNSNQIKQVYAK